MVLLLLLLLLIIIIITNTATTATATTTTTISINYYKTLLSFTDLEPYSSISSFVISVFSFDSPPLACRGLATRMPPAFTNNTTHQTNDRFLVIFLCRTVL